MHTGHYIRIIRGLLDISQKDLAEKLNIRVKTLKTIESMDHHTSTGIQKMATALAIEPEDITNFDAEEIKTLLGGVIDSERLNNPASLIKRILSSGRTTKELIEILQDNKHKSR